MRIPYVLLAMYIPGGGWMTATEMMAEEDLHQFLFEHGDRIYTYLCILCRDDDAASEALQNAYVKFIEQVRRQKVRKESAPQYLMTIARNDHFSQRRRDGRSVVLPDDTIDTAYQERASREELARELQLVLLDTIEDVSLPEDIRTVIRLRFIEEVGVDVICKETNRSQATVYRLMEKALSILADACRKAGLNLEEVGL